MIELAYNYCGNGLTDVSLAQQVEAARQNSNCIEVDLVPTDSAKGRIHAQSRSGDPVGIVKGRDRLLREGDVFETESGRLLVVHLATEKVIALRFTGNPEGVGMQLIHLGHMLGNHHWPIIVQDEQIYVQLVADSELLEEMIQGFNIPGLTVSYEARSPNQPLTFSPHSHEA